MTKVLVVDIHAEIYRDRLRAEFPDLQFALFHNASEVTGDLSDIDVMIMFGIEIRDHMLAEASRLKWIQSLATGIDHFLRCPSLRPDVVISTGRGIHGPPMREQVVYLMMAVSRDAPRQVEDYRHRIWARRLWSTLNGKTAVIVGTGIVGAAIGEVLKALGMHVVGVSRTPRQVEGFDEMISTDRLLEAAARADYLVNVLPAAPCNFALFDAAVFAAMKATAYYISASRGQTVDEAALVAALRERRIAGAGFDVFQTEPLPPDSPFWSLPNVFITPHVGGYVVEYEDFIMPLIIDNMPAFLAGRPGEMREYCCALMIPSPRGGGEGRRSKRRIGEPWPANLHPTPTPAGGVEGFIASGIVAKSARKSGGRHGTGEAQIPDRPVRRGAASQIRGTAASGFQDARQGTQFRRPDHGARRGDRALVRIQQWQDHIARRAAPEARHQIDVQKR